MVLTPCCLLGYWQRQKGNNPLHQGSQQEKRRGNGPFISSCFFPRHDSAHIATTLRSKPRGLQLEWAGNLCVMMGEAGCWTRVCVWGGGLCTDTRPVTAPRIFLHGP